MSEDLASGKPVEQKHSPSAPHGAATNEPPENEQVGVSGVNIAAHPATNLRPPPTNSEHANDGNHSSKDGVKDWLEKIGLVVGIVAALVICGQYWEMIKTNREMRQAFVADNRAWVTPFEMIVEENPKDTNFVHLKLMFKNTGQTPALNISIAQSTGFPDSKTNTPPAIPDAMMLGPGVATFIPVYNVPREMAKVVPGNVPFCIFGRIAYDDIFGNHHWTEFCWGSEGPVAYQNWPGRNTCDDAKQDNPK